MNEDYQAITQRLNLIEQSIKENNTMLHRIERRARITLFFSSLKWFVIIGISLGAFYYTRPYLEQLMDAYNQISNIGSMFR